MTEKLLQYIWQFQYFNRHSLCTTQGEPVSIIHPGQPNLHQGPDFFNGRIKIGQTEWAGHIELHLKSSDWYRHSHENDERYGKVILHVVHRHDEEVTDMQGNNVPVLELQNRIAHSMLEQYTQLMQTPQTIPCGTGITQLQPLGWRQWTDRLLAERLLEKCNRVRQQLLQTENHWEETCWRMVATYFGGSVNKESFRQVATSLPLRILARHKDAPIQLEALLQGQAGLLHKNHKDDYMQLLYREYQFLQKKYSLQVVNQPPAFLRMRPVNFPGIRLAQLAMLIHQSTHLFSRWAEAQNLQEARQLLEVTANDYWHYRYKADEPAEFLPKKTGSNLIDTVLINAVIPILFAYGHHQMQDAIREKALDWLQQMPAESNNITRMFAGLGRKPDSAATSQAMLTLANEYCYTKRCLECAAGHALLRQNQTG